MEWVTIFRVLGISAIPFLELRLAIPMGIAAGLEPLAATFWGVAGNLVQVPLSVGLIQLLRRVALRWQWAARWSAALDRAGERHQEKVRRFGWLGLALLVAIPIPGTGLWTGSAIAGLMRMPLLHTLLALSTGVVMAGILVGIVSAGAFEVLEAVE